MHIALVFLLSSVGALANNREVEIPFSFERVSCLTQEYLAHEFGIALQNSRESNLWPNEKSIVQGRGAPEVGKLIQVTYRTGFFSPTYSYQLTAFDRGGFTYEATGNHPFRGGATVSFEQLPSGVAFRWIGKYFVAENNQVQQRFFRNFVPQFFAALEGRLQQAEQTVCQSGAEF